MHQIRRLFVLAPLVLLSGCGLWGHVDKPFVESLASIPPGIAGQRELLAGPEPGFSLMSAGADMEGLTSDLTRRTDYRAVSGGWARVQPTPSGTAMLTGEILSHRFLYGPSAMGTPLTAGFYVLQKSESLYLLGGLIAANVQHADRNLADPGAGPGRNDAPPTYRGFFGFQVTGVSSVRGSIFPMEAGKEMSFVLEGRSQKGDALNTRTTIRVLGEINDPERKLKIGGPLFVVAIERDGLLGLAPEIAYEIDWNRHSDWHRGPSTECVVYSAALGWPLLRAYSVQRSVNASIMGFDRATVLWEARNLSRRGEAPYEATNRFPAVSDGISAAAVLDSAHPQHRRGNLAQELGRSGSTALGRFNLSMQSSSMAALRAGQTTPQGGATEVGTFFGALLKDGTTKKADGTAGNASDCGG